MAYARGSSAWRARYWGAACTPDLVDATVGSGLKRKVDARAKEAFTALGLVFDAFDYALRSEDTGHYNCRKITGGSSMSSHAWATSGDYNWKTNPYRTDRLVTDMDKAMVDAATAIRTKRGVQVFRWGGDWDGRPETKHSNYDAMHFEVIATPAELAKGIDWKTVKMAKLDVRKPKTWPTLEFGDFGPTVKRLQRELNDAAGKSLVAVDGDFGKETRKWVRSYQRSRKLKVDGVVGLATWTALFSSQPPAKGNTPSPTKTPEKPKKPTAKQRREAAAAQLEKAAAAATKELRR